jgi:hypothetical protein
VTIDFGFIPNTRKMLESLRRNIHEQTPTLKADCALSTVWAEIVGWYVGPVNNSFAAYYGCPPIPHLVITYSIKVDMKAYICCLRI